MSSLLGMTSGCSLTLSDVRSVCFTSSYFVFSVIGVPLSVVMPLVMMCRGSGAAAVLGCLSMWGVGGGGSIAGSRL